MILEACVETLDQATHAEQQGADRLELCSRLDLDGLTPSDALIASVLDQVGIPVKVMIRPRGGDFVYTQSERNQILRIAENMANKQIAGIVFGAIQDKRLDISFIQKVIKASGNKHMTIHKAIDATANPLSEVTALRAIDTPHAILTSGGHPTAMDGSQVLRKMIEAGGSHSTIIAAGSITNKNISVVHASIGGYEYHGRKIVGELPKA